MKKLLALLPIAALVLTGCGGSGKQTEAPAAQIQPADHTPAPANSRLLWEQGDLKMYEVNITTSSGNTYRCFVTHSNYVAVTQTCNEYSRR